MVLQAALVEMVWKEVPDPTRIHIKVRHMEPVSKIMIGCLCRTFARSSAHSEFITLLIKREVPDVVANVSVFYTLFDITLESDISDEDFRKLATLGH